MLDENMQKLRKAAEEVLNQNWTGRFTCPSRNLYPHQWSWDSAFIAIGNSHVNQKRAQEELVSLFSGQWRNGLVPHIVFHYPEKPYFPGPEFWKVVKLPFGSPDKKTSGIVQPPLHATAALSIYANACDKEMALRFLKQLYPRLVAWHNYLYRERDVDREGLVFIRHPWESGQDNSPLWDPFFESIQFNSAELPHYQRVDHQFADAAHRPEKKDYDLYVYLIKVFQEANYREDVLAASSPFLVQDVLFNSILCQANRDLAEIALLLNEDPQLHRKRAEKTARAVNEKLWDEDHAIYADYDMTSGSPIDVHVASGFLPLFANIPSRQRALRMFEYMNTRCFCKLSDDCYAVPSFDKCEPGFSPERYWRGPIWININWLLCRGLDNYGLIDYGHRVKHSIIDLPKHYGFYEYFDPERGCGLGSDRFSWTAALLIDTLAELEKKSR